MARTQRSPVTTSWPETKAPGEKNLWNKSELVKAAEQARKAQEKEEAWIRKHLSD